MTIPARLSLDQLDRRLELIRQVQGQAKVQPGWIRYLRVALGMTMKSLAERTNLSIPSIQQAERNEVSGAITVNKLKQMAEAMGCDFVYAFVPKIPIQQSLKMAALTKARRLLKIADLHMGLEDQRVERKMEKRIEQLAATLLEKGDVW